MWNKMTLRCRLTLLTALILAAVCVGLTYFSIANAGLAFSTPSNNSPRLHIPQQVDEVKPVPSQSSDNVYYIYEKNKRNFTNISILYMCVFIVIGTGLTYLIAGRVLKPVTDLSRNIRDIDENNLTTRITAIHHGDEVAKLTSSFNHLLTRLENAFESQRRFAQHAAHEFKTPLASIMANIEVLQLDKDPSKEEYKEVIEITKESTEKLIQLVSELLQLHVSVCEESMIKTDAYEMFEAIFHELDPSIKQKNIRTSNDCQCMILGIPDLLHHAFYNIVENAIKYNKDGGQITISSDKNKIVISDTGIGIPAAYIQHIFEPFYCVDPSRSRKLGGSGLGLSVVKAIIEKHNGNIHIESNIGVGTTITVEI